MITSLAMAAAQGLAPENNRAATAVVVLLRAAMDGRFVPEEAGGWRLPVTRFDGDEEIIEKAVLEPDGTIRFQPTNAASVAASTTTRRTASGAFMGAVAALLLAGMALATGLWIPPVYRTLAALPFASALAASFLRTRNRHVSDILSPQDFPPALTSVLLRLARKELDHLAIEHPLELGLLAEQSTVGTHSYALFAERPMARHGAARMVGNVQHRPYSPDSLARNDQGF